MSDFGWFFVFRTRLERDGWACCSRRPSSGEGGLSGCSVSQLCPVTLRLWPLSSGLSTGCCCLSSHLPPSFSLHNWALGRECSQSLIWLRSFFTKLVSTQTGFFDWCCFPALWVLVVAQEWPQNQVAAEEEREEKNSCLRGVTNSSAGWNFRVKWYFCSACACPVVIACLGCHGCSSLSLRSSSCHGIIDFIC